MPRKTSTTRKPTAKHAAKPGRKPGRKAHKPDLPAQDSTEAIAQAVSSALGRTLADLMTGGAPAAAVHLMTGDRNPFDDVPQALMRQPDAPRAFPFGGATGEALMRVMAAVDNAEQIAIRAENRLGPVLCPSKPVATGTSGATAPNWSTIAHLLHDIADRLNAINAHQADTIDRLEV